MWDIEYAAFVFDLKIKLGLINLLKVTLKKQIPGRSYTISKGTNRVPEIRVQ